MRILSALCGIFPLIAQRRHGIGLAFMPLLASCALFVADAHAQVTQPLVAIHDSELTRGMESTTTQWSSTNWHYFVMPESLQEMLRSDGTTFTVVNDADIAKGLLLPNGLPKYPIVISLAAEAVQDAEVQKLTDYVAAGGFLFVGSSAFTRNADGAPRGDFAFAKQLGLHASRSGQANWADNLTLSKTSEHRLISHIPNGKLQWQLPSAAESMVPNQSASAPHQIWQVRVSDATVIAQGDNSPLLAIKKFGLGYFIYCASLQPLLTHGGAQPGMYSYAIFRNAIEWAYESAQLPLVRLSPWPFPYDAAFIVRHDLGEDAAKIEHIEASARVEQAKGIKGDYYLCAGTLREGMARRRDWQNVLASLQRTVGLYGAGVGPQNGGLRHPEDQSHGTWSWGLDEALDAWPSGYADGKTYAQTSLTRAFADIESYLPASLTPDFRICVAPGFRANREDSLQIQEQLGVKVVGEQKLGPFPHWTLSTRTSDKRYGMLSQPVSDWFIENRIASSLEPSSQKGHNSATLHDAVDFYYGLGGLINFPSQTLSTGEGAAGLLVADYINYCMNTNLHPRLWAANASGIYNWWSRRSTAQVVVHYSTNGNKLTANINVTGASDPGTTVELAVPKIGLLSILQVTMDGLPAMDSAFRVNDHTIKLLFGTTVTNAQVVYSLLPEAEADFYSIAQGETLTVSPGGVLGNDQRGIGGTGLTATLVSGPKHGSLDLKADGSFRYTPGKDFSGTDGFAYQASNGRTNSSPCPVVISVTAPLVLFSDNFTRSADSGPSLPWRQKSGTWNIHDGALTGSSTASYGNIWVETADCPDYNVTARFKFTSVKALGAGIGGRLNPTTGAHYAAWVYPEESPVGSRQLKLIKFQSWESWSGTAMQTVELKRVGTSPHTLSLTFHGDNISVSFDDSPVVNVVDKNFDGTPAYASGSVCADLYTDDAPYNFVVDDFKVAKWFSPPVIASQPMGLTNVPGTIATFKIRAEGQMLKYQWRFNGADIPGATTSSYTRANLQPNDSGEYSALVSNPSGRVASAPAKLSVVVPLPPRIILAPQPRTVLAGEDVTFTIAAIGTLPLNYQWQFNGANIAGATSTNLVLKNVQPANIGNYSVTASNIYGAIATPPVMLNVNYTLTVPPSPGGLVAVWPVQSSYAPGAKVTLVPSPATGFRFVEWSGDVWDSTNQLVLTIRSNTTVNATFQRSVFGRLLGGL